MDSAGGPPISTGIPLGMARMVDDGSRTGSPQLIALSPMRDALVPIRVTVGEPNTTMASPSGATGGPGGGGGPLNEGLGSFGMGAQAVPGGIRMCGTPSELRAFVPTVVAGIELMSTGPSGGVPASSAAASPMAWPTSSPPGSNTIPTNGFGIGVGTGAGMGTISKWMSTPSTMSMNVDASIPGLRRYLQPICVSSIARSSNHITTGEAPRVNSGCSSVDGCGGGITVVEEVTQDQRFGRVPMRDHEKRRLSVSLLICRRAAGGGRPRSPRRGLGAGAATQDRVPSAASGARPACRFVRLGVAFRTMPAVTLRAHWNGERILLDEPYEIPPDAILVVTVLEPSAVDATDDWTMAAKLGLARAYGDDEPDYVPDDVAK